MNTKSAIMLALALSASTNVFSAAPAEQTPVQAVKEESGVKFDAAALTYSFGNKNLVLKENGLLLVLSGKKELGRAYFFIATPYQYWMTNQGKASLKGNFDGKSMRVTEIKTEGEKITFLGKTPWNKKDEPAIAGDWQITVEPVAKGKIEVNWSYVIPDGQKRKDDAVFMAIKGCKLLNAGALGTWVPGTKGASLHSWKMTVLTLDGTNPEDTYRIETVSWKVDPPSSLRLGKNKNKKFSAVFDFNPVVKK